MYPAEITQRYVVGRVIGKGAFGKVFHGTLKSDPRAAVAIKYVGACARSSSCLGWDAGGH